MEEHQCYSSVDDLLAKYCKHCVHCKNLSKETGACHKNAPTTGGNDPWPTVKDVDTCGDFKSRFEENALLFREGVADLLYVIEQSEASDAILQNVRHANIIRMTKRLLHI